MIHNGMPVRVLLISTYELGRQPFGLASPAAWLRDAGVEVTCLDLSRQPFRDDLASVDFVALHLPMHTATRLAVPIIKRIRRLNPMVRLCCYGLYATLNAELLHLHGVQHVLGGEFEQMLVRLATSDIGVATSPVTTMTDAPIPRLQFLVPDRRGLPPLSQYASLQLGPNRKIVGYTEASRGCKHVCRHCPVVPVYKGQFRVVPVDVVLEDIRKQVEQGAEHITFGDPDFFNGIRHAMAIAEEIAREFSGLTYDATIKVEHLLRHKDCLALLRKTGCLFVTSAVESFDDGVLSVLRKGHTCAEVSQAVARCREVELILSPTFVAFTPWTTLDSYCAFLEKIIQLDLVEHVAPIQLAIRLLVPAGSKLLELPDFKASLKPFDPIHLVHPWQHTDQRVDALCDEVGKLVSRRLKTPRRELFDQVRELAHEHAGRAAPLPTPMSPARAEIPYLNEPWYC